MLPKSPRHGAIRSSESTITMECGRRRARRKPRRSKATKQEGSERTLGQVGGPFRAADAGFPKSLRPQRKRALFPRPGRWWLTWARILARQRRGYQRIVCWSERLPDGEIRHLQENSTI